MKNEKFRGTGVALTTPFRQDGKIDFGALEKLINFNIDNGVNYFVVLGTTGESVTLSENEKTEVFKFVSNAVQERVPLVAGIGGNSTEKISEELRNFNADGYDAILSVSPYYNKPSQEGIFQHYMQLAGSTEMPLPFIIYNVPGRTSSNIPAEITLRLANASEKFVGIKEASGNFSQIMSIVKNRPKDFLVISGDDLITLPLISFGCDGVISVVAQAFPAKFSSMVNEALEGNFSKASQLHFELLDFMEMFFAEGSPAGVKAALNILGICENVLRLPLVKVSDSLREKINRSINNL